MGNQFVRIDEKTWKRAMHCQVFRNSVEPDFLRDLSAGYHQLSKQDS